MNEKIKKLQSQVAELLIKFEEENNLSIKGIGINTFEVANGDSRLIGTNIIFGAN